MRLSDFHDPGEPYPDRRPTMRDDAATADYWLRLIEWSKGRLRIPERARRAADDKRYVTHELPRDTANAISRKLKSKKAHLVTDYPYVTPIFVERDDEERWFDVVRALVSREMRQDRFKRVLRSLVEDNFYADVAWLRLTFDAQYSAVAPRPRRAFDVRGADEEERITRELQALLLGDEIGVEPDDQHELHRQRHQEHMDDLVPLVDAGAFDASVLTALAEHIVRHEQADHDVVSERITMRRIAPYLVYYDPEAACWDECEWYAIECVERLEVLQRDPNLKHTAGLRGSPGVVIDEWHDQRTEGGGRLDKESIPPKRERYVRYFTIHSRVDEQILIVAADQPRDQKPLLVDAWPYPGDLVRPLVLNAVEDRVHGVSEIHMLAGAHDEYVAVRGRIRRHVEKVPAAKRFIKTGMYNNKEWLSQLKNPEQVDIPVDDLEGVKTEQYPPLDSGLREQEARLEAEMNEISGVPEFAQVALTSETATATAARDRQFSAVLAETKELIADLTGWVCEQIVAIWRENGTVDQLVKTVGDRGRAWHRLIPALLPHNVHFEVDADSLAPTRRDAEKRQAMELLEAVAPFIDPQSAAMNGRPLIKRLLRRFDLIEDLDVAEDDEWFMADAAEAPPAEPARPPEPGGLPPEQAPEMAGVVPAESGPDAGYGMAPEGYEAGAYAAAGV